jgi:hypothetical protein
MTHMLELMMDNYKEIFVDRAFLLGKFIPDNEKDSYGYTVERPNLLGSMYKKNRMAETSKTFHVETNKSKLRELFGDETTTEIKYLEKKVEVLPVAPTLMKSLDIKQNKPA